ncbi:MAG: ISNCY family transposase [Gammaproteobacteria bacterium]|nr:ISNCY family transposase [Gammaproteobacteria bacterium]
MRFEEAYDNYQDKRLSQGEAARLLGISDRTFRRYLNRYEEEGLDGLADKRLNEISHRRAPVDEVVQLETLYRDGYDGWNVRHFHRWYRTRHQGTRSYTWVKNHLQKAGLVDRGRKRGPHRKKRLPAALPGMLLHQDGSTHQWVPDRYWDLIVTMDDATNEHYSMRFVEEEGTWSSFLGVRDVLETRGLFCSLYMDRGSHYWHTPEAGGKVDKQNPTQFGAALGRLGIEWFAAYSPQARGRSERAFGTHQGRLPRELALAGITEMEEANRYLQETYREAFNEEFAHPAREPGSAFLPLKETNLDEYLCERHERVVGKDNTVQFEKLHLQIPADTHRYHYVKTRVKVLRHMDRSLSVYHGPRCLARYTASGELETDPCKTSGVGPARGRTDRA